MKRILVSGASGIVGYGCLKSLMKTQKYYLIGTSIYDSMVAREFSNEFIVAPNTNEEHYFSWLKATIQKRDIDLIIPGIEIDVYKWKLYRDEFEKIGVKVLLNSDALLEDCEDKWRFYEKMQTVASEIAIPTMLSNNYCSVREKFGEKIIVKPRRGYASKGVKILSTKHEFDNYVRENGNMFIAQKVIIGDEYTIGAFFDEKHDLCCMICMKRMLGSGGYTEKAEVTDANEVEEIVRKVGKKFEAVGITNFQFIKDNEGFKLLEINPRISSSTYIRTLFGYNECEMGVQYLLENSMPIQPQIRSGKVERYVEEIVIYDRDNF